MTLSFIDLVDGSLEAGSYLLRSNDPPLELQRKAEVEGLAFFHINGHQVADKLSFLRETKEKLKFPDYFGMNWDALNDCLLDFSWHPAKWYVILYDEFEHFATHAASDFEVAVNIMGGAAQDGNTKMYVLLRGDESKLPLTLKALEVVAG